MDEKELKTSVGQRVGIAVIAILMIVSIIAGYAAIVLNSGNSSSTTGGIDMAKLAEYQQAYTDKQREFGEAAQADFEHFVQYRSEVVAYNEANANNNGVQTRDLEVGTGKELTEGDTDYLAYYIGWCADETVFDSTFNSNDNPTAFKQALLPSDSLIDGWKQGVIGMRLGGIREITVPGELAYKDLQEICGGTYKPLRFLIYAVANEGRLGELMEEIDRAQMNVAYYSQYGISYDELVQGVITDAEADGGETAAEAEDTTEAGSDANADADAGEAVENAE